MLTVDNALSFSSQISKLIKGENALIDFISKNAFACLWIWNNEAPDNLLTDKQFSNFFSLENDLPNKEGVLYNFSSDSRFAEFSGILKQVISNQNSLVKNDLVREGNLFSGRCKMLCYPVVGVENKLVAVVGGCVAEENSLVDDKMNTHLLNEIDLLKKELQSEKFLFNQVMSNLPLNVYTKDLNLKKTYANLSEIQFCGAATLEEVIGKTDVDFYGEEVAKHSMQEDVKVIHNKNFQIHKEVKFTKKDGSDAWLFSSKLPLLNEKNEVTGILGTSIDITDKKKIEKEFDFQSQLINRIGDSVIAIDNNNLILFWNKAAEDIFGWTKAEVMNKNIFELSPIQRLPESDHLLMNILYEIDTMNGLFSVRTKLGEELIINVQTTPLIQSDGEIYGVIGIGTNETILFRTQKELLRTKEFLLRAQELAKLGAWDLHFDTNKVAWSAVTKEIHEVDSTYVPTLSEAILFYKEGYHRDKVAKVVQEAINEGKPFNFESIIVTKNGREKWIRANGKPIMQDGKCISLHGSFQDITEQKQQQFEIEQKQLLLEALSKQVPGILFQFKMDKNGEFSWPFVSERAKEIYDISPQEYYSNPNVLIEFTDPQYIQPLFEAIQISAQNLSPFVFESKTFSKSGNEKWILTESIPQKQDDGSIVWSGYSQDITGRKLAEIELELTKKNLESIFYSISEVVCSVRPYTDELLFLTPSVEQVYGFSIADAEKNNEILKSAIIDEDKHVLEENYQSLEATGTFSCECRIKHAVTGEIKWISKNGKYIYNDEGKPIRIDCITKDITEKKLRELALVKSEAKFRSYVENAPNVIFTHDLKGNINYIVQNSFASKLSYINRLPEKRNILSLIHPDDSEIVLTTFKYLINHKVAINTSPFRLKTESGNYEWRVVNAAPLLNDDGEITEILTISTDVNELIEKEKALILEKAKANKLSDYYQSLLDSKSVYVVKTDTKGYYTYVNEGFKKSFGCDDSIIGTFSFDLIIQEDWDLCREAAMKCIQQPEVYHKVNLRKPSKNGEIKMGTWEFIGKLNEKQELEEILCIGYDITELNKLLEETRELLRITADQNNRLQNFTYIISHNIRSHSANLQGVLKLMEETDNEDERLVLFEMLKLSTERLEETIKNLNDIITIKKGINTPKEYKNLYSEIHKTLDILIDDIKESRAKINVDIPLDVQVKVIPAYLDSIILNLLSNALKYRSKERDCEINIEVKKIKNYVVVAFKDNGIGMNMKFVKDKIFGMYKTFHKNSDAKGLGLFLTKNQVEAMDGKIEVDSTENVGSTFKLYFYDEA